MAHSERDQTGADEFTIIPQGKAGQAEQAPLSFYEYATQNRLLDAKANANSGDARKNGRATPAYAYPAHAASIVACAVVSAMSDPTEFKKVKRLRDAVFEAERFIQRAKKAADEIEEGRANWLSNIEYAAAKRSSMDLTRSLAELRRSLYR